MKRTSAVLILTHGRADRVQTVSTLRKLNYKGDIYIVIDNLDKEEEKYRELYGDKVIMFDKPESAKHTDTMDNFEGLNVVVFARNQCHRIAREIGLTHFLVLDDDYSSFQFRHIEENSLKGTDPADITPVFEAFYDFLDESNALSVTMAQGGDFIGGAQSGNFQKGISRKAMNSWFCRTDRPFEFIGRINEDANTVALLGSQGHLFFTIMQIMLTQGTTQMNEGGLTGEYLRLGTYVKSFYSVMAVPSAITVQAMGDTHMRLHHRVDWGACVPKILSEASRKS